MNWAWGHCFLEMKMSFRWLQHHLSNIVTVRHNIFCVSYTSSVQPKQWKFPTYMTQEKRLDPPPHVPCTICTRSTALPSAWHAGPHNMHKPRPVPYRNCILYTFCAQLFSTSEGVQSLAVSWSFAKFLSAIPQSFRDFKINFLLRIKHYLIALTTS